jgi:hypothetical protein
VVSCAFPERVTLVRSTAAVEVGGVVEMVEVVRVADPGVEPMVDPGVDAEEKEYRFIRALPPQSWEEFPGHAVVHVGLSPARDNWASGLTVLAIQHSLPGQESDNPSLHKHRCGKDATPTILQAKVLIVVRLCIRCTQLDRHGVVRVLLVRERPSIGGRVILNTG